MGVTAGVRDDVARPDLNGGREQVGVKARPRVVDEIDTRVRGCASDLRPPGVQGEDEIGVCRSRPFEEGHHAVDLHRDGDLFTLLTGSDAADVDDVRAEGHSGVEGGEGAVEVGVPIALVERVFGAIDDRHDRRAGRVEGLTTQHQASRASQRERGHVGRHVGVTHSSSHGRGLFPSGRVGLLIGHGLAGTRVEQVT